MARRTGHIRMYDKEVEKLKEMKREMYGEERAEDIPHAAAVMDMIDALRKREQYL